MFFDNVCFCFEFTEVFGLVCGTLHSADLLFQMNGSYQSYNYYYDFFPPGEGFNSYGGGGGHGSSKRSLYARDGRGESKESRDSDRSGPDGEEKDRIFNDDFVSFSVFSLFVGGCSWPCVLI